MKSIEIQGRYILTSEGKVFSKGSKKELLFDKSSRYFRISLKGIKYLVHRLVAQYFIPNPNNLPVVRHLDGDKENNDVSNLAWGTHSDNESDKKNHGTYYTRITNSNLSLDDIEDIKVFKKLGARTNDLAKAYGVGRHAISNIVKGKTWSHL